jgi:hypothetical protein
MGTSFFTVALRGAILLSGEPKWQKASLSVPSRT